MEFTFKGPAKDITIRGVKFAKDKPVEVKNASLAAKISVLDYFEQTADELVKTDD